MDVILIKSIFLLLPILATNQFLKVPTIFPGWDGGGGVSWSSLSRLRGRDPISSGFPSPPFINLFCLSENLFVCNVIILLFRISAKCSPTWYYQKLNLAQVWSSESSNNPDHCKCLLLQHHQHICWWYMIYVSFFPISPKNGSPGPVRCLIREILVGSLIKPGLGTFTFDLSGHKSWDRGKYEFTNLHIWSILKTHWTVVWFLFESNLAEE